VARNRKGDLVGPASSPGASPARGIGGTTKAAATNKNDDSPLRRCRASPAAPALARSLRLAALVTLARLAAAAAATARVEGDVPNAVAAALAQTETGIVLLNG
jgi:hypothetical protein